jgi:hypothetical protein
MKPKQLALRLAVSTLLRVFCQPRDQQPVKRPDSMGDPLPPVVSR